MKQYRNVAAAMLAVALGYGSMAVFTGGDERSASAIAVTPTTDLASYEWTDGLQHLVVTTVNGVPGVARGPRDTASAAGLPRRPHPSGASATSDTSDASGTTGATQPGAGTTATIVHADGSVGTVTFAPASLVAVTPVDDAEADALAAAPSSLIVVDADGAVGPASQRYLLSGTTLTALTLDAQSTPPATTSRSDSEIAAALEQIDGVRNATVVGPGVVAVTAEPAAEVRDRAEAIDGVLTVEEDLIFFPSDDARQGEQWALRNTGAASQAGGYRGVADADIAGPAAWTVATGSGTTVAVIDTGVDTNHPDLAARIWTNTADPCGNGVDDDGNGHVDDCRGWDFGTSDNDPNPDLAYSGQAHGTHVAGIVAAATNGVGIVGIAPEASIMALKTANASGQLSTSGIIAAIHYARANGADVINLSLGTAPGTPRSAVASMEAAIDDAVAAGVVVVAASGNNGTDTTYNTVWPAGFSVYNSGVITVGASTNSDTKASFSNTGAAVNLLAPGYFILSTMPNAGYGFMSGTSMAAPYTAGAVAVVLSAAPAMTPDAVRSRLVATAATISAGERLDVAAAVGVSRGAETGTDVTVAFSGAAALRPDTPGTLGIELRAGANVAATQVRLSVATREAGTLAAVDGLVAEFSDPSGSLGAATTGTTGAFATLPIRDIAALHDAGTSFAATLAVPAGDYAFVVELLDDSGTAVGGSRVAYLTISAPPSGSTGPSPTTTAPTSTATATPPAPSSTAPGTANPPAPGTTFPSAPGTTEPAAQRPPATTAPRAPSPTNPAGGAPGATLPAAPVTSSPSSGTTPAGGGPGAPVAPPTTTSGGRTAPTSPASTPTTNPVPSPSTTAGGNAPVTTAPAPRTTTPPPAPDSDGAYRLTSMQPRLADLCGTTWLSIRGTFPTTVPVYVWFGERGPVVPAESDGSTLTLKSPATTAARVSDVIVRFTTDRTYSLTLADAFTFYDGGRCGTGAPATTAPATSVPPNGGATPVTTAPRSATTTPAGAAPRPPATNPPTPPAPPAPPTTAAPGGPTVTTAPAAPPTTSDVVGTRGSLTLRRMPASGALSTLTTARWPAAGCRLDKCPAARP